jgi:hypothetical protein
LGQTEQQAPETQKVVLCVLVSLWIRNECTLDSVHFVCLPYFPYFSDDDDDDENNNTHNNNNNKCYCKSVIYQYVYIEHASWWWFQTFISA